jgi:TPR repeat protein
VEAEQAWDRLLPEEMAAQTAAWDGADGPEAVKWLTRASAGGHGAASHNLAMHIWRNRGALPEEEAKARAKAVLRLAHEQGWRVFEFADW